jgi:hypothetical protein
MVPPPLAWIPNFALSMSRALGCKVEYTLNSSVNALMYKLSFFLSEPQNNKTMLAVWNALQQYAAKNDAVLSDKATLIATGLLTTISMRRRLGLPMDEVP